MTADIFKFFAVMLRAINLKEEFTMEKTLYVNKTKFSVEVSNFDWHQSQNEIQCILIFLSAFDKKEFVKATEDIVLPQLQLDDMFLSQHWYTDIEDTQAVVFGAYYSIPPAVDSYSDPFESSYHEYEYDYADYLF